jgi:hypothetical protein
VARAMFSAGHWENAGRKKVLRPCPKGCGKECGAPEMKAHIPHATGRPLRPGTPPAPANRRYSLRVNQSRTIELTRKGPVQRCPARACFATK